MSLLRALLSSLWVRYVLTLLLLAAVVVKVRPQDLAAAAGSANPGLLLAALALTPPFFACKALRWHRMLSAAGVRATFAESTVSLIGGMGLALVTPARLGELIRVAYLRDPQKLKIGGLVMLDKGFDVLVLAGLSIVGAWRLLGPPAGLAFTLATACGLVAVYWPTPLHAFLRRLSSRLPFEEKQLRVWESLESLSPRSTTTFLALTLLSFVVVLVQFALVLMSWHSWSLDIVILTFPLVILTNVLPITIGGLGIREAAAAALLSHYGVRPADAALAALLMFAINTALPGLLGSLLLPVAGARPSSVASADRP